MRSSWFTLDLLFQDDVGQFSYDNFSQIHWISFLDGRQRVLLFTEDVGVVTKARQAEELEQFQQEVKVSLQSLGLSLINNASRQEIAYIGITRSTACQPPNAPPSPCFMCLTGRVFVCLSQFRGCLGDEAKEPVEAVQPEEHQPVGKNLSESAEREDRGRLGQSGCQPRGQRSTHTQHTTQRQPCRTNSDYVTSRAAGEPQQNPDDDAPTVFLSGEEELPVRHPGGVQTVGARAQPEGPGALAAGEQRA